MNDNTMNGANETTERRCVRRRSHNFGSVTRPRKMEIRLTRELSSKVASIQGLIFKYGRRETLSELFEKVMFPALQEYVKPYVYRAKADREAQSEVRT